MADDYALREQELERQHAERTLATIERWWAVDPGARTDESVQFAFAMDELVKDNAGRPSLPAFLDWLGREALDPEMYYEWLRADPSNIDPLFVAFEAGWFARKGEAVGYATGTD
jgi:hypothetical protein